LREALPPRAVPAGVFAVVAVTTAAPSSPARRFFDARTSGSGVTGSAGVSSSSSLNSDEDDEGPAEVRALDWIADRFLGEFRSSEPAAEDELPDVSLSELELESELEEDGAFRVDWLVPGTSLSSSELESELESDSELEVDMALRFDRFGS